LVGDSGDAWEKFQNIPKWWVFHGDESHGTNRQKNDFKQKIKVIHQYTDVIILNTNPNNALRRNPSTLPHICIV